MLHSLIHSLKPRVVTSSTVENEVISVTQNGYTIDRANRIRKTYMQPRASRLPNDGCSAWKALPDAILTGCHVHQMPYSLNRLMIMLVATSRQTPTRLLKSPTAVA